MAQGVTYAIVGLSMPYAASRACYRFSVLPAAEHRSVRTTMSRLNDVPCHDHLLPEFFR